jgi:hypothetical protein
MSFFRCNIADDNNKVNVKFIYNISRNEASCFKSIRGNYAQARKSFEYGIE